MLDEHVELFERAVVEQQLQPLPRRELASCMLGFDALDPTADSRLRAPVIEPFEYLFISRDPSMKVLR